MLEIIPDTNVPLLGVGTSGLVYGGQQIHLEHGKPPVLVEFKVGLSSGAEAVLRNEYEMYVATFL